jgi:hypothetical protein
MFGTLLAVLPLETRGPINFEKSCCTVTTSASIPAEIGLLATLIRLGHWTTEGK